ncbi:hypothetical protein J2X97_000193 [Epilithonimonas hungarica]|uniref:hypothetical protein n=1 Tax=Epilithonimonas hungarica TaxID=454006 RepID=UPI002783C05A|nr:hypothetical protein [Epilithonimonas hungarica]MDP9954556.1 hypothetical protein [Epilithonimonas hungarica]
MKIKITLTLSILFAITSCDQITDNYWQQKEEENHTSPFMGKWVGTYNGNEVGTLTLDISKNGNITGSLGRTEVDLASYVYDDGTLQPVISNTLSFTLYGNLKDKKGTWKDKDKQGTWTLTKQ